MELGNSRQTGTSQSLPVAASLDVFFGCEVWNPAVFQAEAAPHGFRIASTQELAATHELAERIMAMRLAPLQEIAAAHARTQATAWVCDAISGEGGDTDISGVILLLPLTWDGEAALRSGRFNFAAPQADFVCAPGNEMASLYLWLCAGSDRGARRSIMQTAQAWFDRPCSGLRVYGRAASNEGLRAFASFGFRRLTAARSDIFILDRRGNPS